MRAPLVSTGTPVCNGELPRMWFVCPAIGVPSEVWLCRQMRGIKRLNMDAITWQCESQPGKIPEESVYVLPFEPSPYDRPGRWLYRLRCLPGRNFYATIGAEHKTLAHYMRQTKPDVVFCHYGYTGLRILPLVNAFRVPLVVHFNGLDISLHNRWYRWSLLRALPQFSAIVVVGEHQREWLRRLGVPEAKLHLIPYGVPLQDFSPSLKVTQQPCRFLSVGRFVHKKAPLNTIRAFAACAGENKGVTLRMIGDGPLKDAAVDLAAKLGLQQQITFLGAQPNGIVRQEMQQAAVFVQHSVTANNGDMEGWPVAIGEAAASGLPVVATRHGGILQQVEHGKTGFLVDEQDWKAMGDAMSQLAKSPALRGELSLKARSRAVSMFDLETQISKLENVLLALAGQTFVPQLTHVVNSV